MNRKLGKGLRILGLLLLAAFMVWTCLLLSTYMYRANLYPKLDIRFNGGWGVPHLCEWYAPATNGAPRTVVTCYWDGSRLAQCYLSKGSRIENYHTSEGAELARALMNLGSLEWKRGDDSPVNADSGYVSIQSWWSSPQTSGTDRASYPLDKMPPALAELKKAVDVCLQELPTAEFHHSYIRFRPVPPSQDMAAVIAMPETHGSGFDYHFLQRDVLKYKWGSKALIPIDKGVNPFRCIWRRYRPGNSVTLRYTGYKRDYYCRVDVYEGNATGTRPKPGEKEVFQ
jgi:hypothetical protein